ncbi:hypothetical protein AVEN_129037-1 [Araneus ventricosus]|uniref:Uncharacterized protein n=1 Tax=Araneus ventricosus TaxID=182803 RepID=A0A4Y2HK90_ARAVE|nr:hypothetical protein AVEN_129037-1 [Araneus ventricosus]
MVQDIPNSNFSLQQFFHSKSASLKQVNANDEVTTHRICSKLVASNSLQTIANAEYVDEPQIRAPDKTHPKPVALATQPAGLRLPKTDYANISWIYTFYFKLPS